MTLKKINQGAIKNCLIVFFFMSIATIAMANSDFYIVKKNDTLYRIAKAHSKTVNELASLNNIKPPYTIEIGQKIQIIAKKVKVTDDAMSQLFYNAQHGDAKAQLKLGWIYFKGEKLQQNYIEGAKWFYKSAMQGNPDAQNKIGTAFSKGQGVKRDFKNALIWYRKSAKQGYSQAQMNLGVMYDFGRGVPENNEEASKWYGLAAMQGHAAAQHNLGIMYEYGEGVKKNYTEAFNWLSKAAEQGYIKSQQQLIFLKEESEKK